MTRQDLKDRIDSVLYEALKFGAPDGQPDLAEIRTCQIWVNTALADAFMDWERRRCAVEQAERETFVEPT